MGFKFVVKNHMVLVSVNCAQLLTLILRRTLACTPKAYCSHYSLVRMILSYINPVEKTLSQKVCSIAVKYKFHQMITYYSQSLFTVTENVLINHNELT